jgi:gas vesicle protein
MSTERDFSTGQFVVAFLSGAAVGAVVTLLTAPQSGRKTRQQIAGAARTARDEMGRIPPAIKDAYLKASDAAKEAFSETYRKETGSRKALAAKEEA